MVTGNCKFLGCVFWKGEEGKEPLQKEKLAYMNMHSVFSGALQVFKKLKLLNKNQNVNFFHKLLQMTHLILTDYYTNRELVR